MEVGKIETLALRVRSLANRHARLVLVLLCVAMTWFELVEARATPLWHDEIYTVEIASLPSMAAIWTAARNGVDLMPPLNTIVTHDLGRLVPLTEVTARLPPLVAYLTFVVVLFEMVRRRSSTIVAVSAVLLAFFTAAFLFSYTARGYAMMLALTTVALFAWSEAAGDRQRAWFLPLLTVSFALAVWAHYFAVLTLAPIACGEVVRLVRRRRIDWGVVAALLASAALIVPLVPLVRTAAAESSTYWRRAQWSDVGETYDFLVGPLLVRHFLLLSAVVAATCAAAVAVSRGRARDEDRSGRQLPAHEVAAGLTLMLIPAFAVALGVFVTGAFVPRYALAGVIGFCVVVPLAVWWAGLRGGITDLVLCLGLILSCARVAYATAAQPPRFHTLAEDKPRLLSLLREPEPVAVTGVVFLESWYYTPPELRANMMYVTDRPAALTIDGADTLDRNYGVLKNWAPIQVQDYRSFVGAHPAFHIYTEGKFGWLPSELRADGATLTDAGREGYASIYNVDVPAQMARGAW